MNGDLPSYEELALKNNQLTKALKEFEEGNRQLKKAIALVMKFYNTPNVAYEGKNKQLK